jgi:hypothetical protein
MMAILFYFLIFSVFFLSFARHFCFLMALDFFFHWKCFPSISYHIHRYC